MATALRHEIKQTRPFARVEHEAHVAIGRSSAMLEHAFAEALQPYGITPTQYNASPRTPESKASFRLRPGDSAQACGALNTVYIMN